MLFYFLEGKQRRSGPGREEERGREKKGLRGVEGGKTVVRMSTKFKKKIKNLKN